MTEKREEGRCRHEEEYKYYTQKRGGEEPETRKERARNVNMPEESDTQ
jgi:DNA-directed RNA polymerase subunit M/transcription elongation factor TFIIS